jgi:hypothetical protein
MDASKHDYITTDAMLASCVRLCGDADSKLIPVGRYKSILFRGLYELEMDTYFSKKRIDAPVPQDLQYELPENTFSVREVYVYNGDKCDLNGAQKLWYKENYFTRGNGFFAKNRGDHGIVDPFYPSGGAFVHIDSTDVWARRENSMVNQLLFYSVENGMLYLSPAVRGYQNLHVVAHGCSTNIGDVPMIPMMMREAVEDFVVEFATRELMAKGPQTFSFYANINRLYRERLDYEGFNGSWAKVMRRVKKMNKGQRADWAEYFSRWSW